MGSGCMTGRLITGAIDTTRLLAFCRSWTWESVTVLALLLVLCWSVVFLSCLCGLWEGSVSRRTAAFILSLSATWQNQNKYYIIFQIVDKNTYLWYIFVFRFWDDKKPKEMFLNVFFTLDTGGILSYPVTYDDFALS
jgi:hypothetical protein